MTIDNIAQNTSLTNYGLQNVLGSQHSSVEIPTNSLGISTEDFENVLNQYLTSITNTSSKKSDPLATALGADQTLVEELLTSSNGRKALTQMTGNHLMNVVTTEKNSSSSSSSNEDYIKALQDDENKAADSVSSDSYADSTFTSLAEYLQTLQLKQNQ